MGKTSRVTWRTPWETDARRRRKRVSPKQGRLASPEGTKNPLFSMVSSLKRLFRKLEIRKHLQWFEDEIGKTVSNSVEDIETIDFVLSSDVL